MSNVQLSNGQASVVISPEAGASLRSLLVAVGGKEHELLAGGGDLPFDPVKLPHGTGSFIMAPWVNRIREGKLIAPDGEHSLPVNSGIHAIHGLVRDRAWDVVEQTASSAVFEIQLAAPWPYAGKVVYRASLDRASFRQTLEVHAGKGERPFPGGVGWHPWFRRSLGGAELTVQADVEAQWEIDASVTPTGKLAKTAASEKLAAGSSFQTGEVDGCFLLRENGGAVVRWPEVTLRMSGTGEITHVMLYSPAHAICVEAQTTTVNAAQLAASGAAQTGTVLVEPERPLTATTVWSWSGAQTA